MALEPRLCLGLSSTLFLGRERHWFLPFLCLGFGRRRTVAGRATFLTPYNFLPFQRVHQVQRTVPQGRCAPWAEAQGLQSPIFRAALMSELKLRPPSYNLIGIASSLP